MFDPIVIVSAEARYQDLLREAQNERRGKRPGIDLIGILALLGLGLR